MKNKRQQFGFSLIEVLMAMGVLTVGMLMVAGTFPVGIHLTAVSTERTLGAVAADEAFAKIRLYGSRMNLSAVTLTASDTQKAYDFNDVYTNYTNTSDKISSSEFEYPSVLGVQIDKRYNWSALFRFSNVNDANQCQITVFASRKVAEGLKYYEADPTVSTYGYPVGNSGDFPEPVKLDISAINNDREIVVGSGYYGSSSFSDYITSDSVIVDNETGNIYRVVEVDVPNDTFYIDRDWQASTYSSFWVVPPPVSGGKNPCVGVYQRIINF